MAVLGHVDHGKSTLLDFIRKSNTVATEAGGITQRVAAYEVIRERDGVEKRITFIDTPGHAAFQTIRARGASVADVAVLVVAADDGVKPQTLEALQSIRDAGIPFVVAINKIDKSNASVERTQASLAQNGVYLEKLGGDVPWVAISAKAGTGVDELLDIILLVAELEELKADASLPAKGYVIEAHRDEKRGLAATLIIIEGTLRSGMAVLAGHALAPVRIMEDHTGKGIKAASFSTPVSLIGFDELPEAGAEFQAYKNKREAEVARPEQHIATAQVLAAESTEEMFILPLIIRADSIGSLEAIQHELPSLSDQRSRVHIVQSGIGAISEGDIKTALAGTTQGVVIGFGVGVERTAESLARQHNVRVEQFEIIYELTKRLQDLLHELRPRKTVEEIVGRARILKQFSKSKGVTTIGGAVSGGYIAKKAAVRIVRRGIPMGKGYVASIQTNKQNTERVDAPREFGAQIEADFEVMQNDTLESIKTTTN